MWPLEVYQDRHNNTGCQGEHTENHMEEVNVQLMAMNHMENTKTLGEEEKSFKHFT